MIEALAGGNVELRLLDRQALARIAAGVRDDALCGADAVLHLAARAHVLEESGDSQLEVYRAANRDLTLRLARQAAAAGVRRLVFVSSIRVNGSSAARPVHADDVPRPDEPYAISKLEAEVGLWKISAETGLEVVVVRPPLIYGPRVKANFRRLLGLAASGLPLPLASVAGWRSLLGVRNLCHLLCVCLEHPAAAGKTFLASDGEDIPLPALIRELAEGMGRPSRLFPAPVGLLRWLAAMAGKASTFEKMTASFRVDPVETFRTLGWSPPVPLRQGLHETARWFANAVEAKRCKSGDVDRW